MLKLKILFVILCFCLISVKSYAHWGTVFSGCLSTSSNYIYTEQNGTQSGVPRYIFDNEDDRWLTSGDVYCINYGAANSCYIKSTVNGYSSTYGTYVTFVWSNCPIDDYTGLILVVVGGVGFLAIRKSLF